MKTRDRILAKAQELFNKKGIGKVSVRSICEELEISLGNFTYHFPDKQKIVVELFFKMIGEMEAAKGGIAISKEKITFLLEYHKAVFKIQNRYKFFYLNTFELINSSSEIKSAYGQHLQKEKRWMKALLGAYSQNGVLQPNTDLRFIDKLIKVNGMVNRFWIIDAELHFDGSEKKKLLHYLALCCSMIEPYLTKSALEEYQIFFDAIETKQQ
ncbi:MAG: TetR/AcrR family transcriptional regulator [Chitinophagaceae bacterium]